VTTGTSGTSSGAATESACCASGPYIRSTSVSPALPSPTRISASSRESALGLRVITAIMRHEWFTLGIHLGYRYDASPIVWPDGRIVNKREDLKSMTGDIVFTEFKIDDLQVRLYGDTGIVLGQGTIKAHEEKQNLVGGKFVWTDTFLKKDGVWKVVASQVTPVLKK